jgi:hypothetical protein
MNERRARRRRADYPAAPDELSSSGSGSWLSAVDGAAAVLAPITVITALLASFGYARTRAFYGYFGIGPGVLDLPVEAYVLRSAGVAFGGGAALVAISVVLLALDQGLHRLREWKPSWRAPLLRAAVLIGLVATVGGLFFALGGYRPPAVPPLAPPVLLAVGSATTLRWLLIAQAEHSAIAERPRPFPRRAALSALVSATLIAVFWATTIYAEDVGRKSAIVADQSTVELPLVTVFSNDFIDLPTDPRYTDKVALPGEPIRYRYGGLRLLTFSNDRWFLISGRYNSDYKSSVIVLRDSESMRVQIADPQPRTTSATG